MTERELITHHFNDLSSVISGVMATDFDMRNNIPFAEAFTTAMSLIVGCPKMMIIGNGGSASIASHMAEDYTKNGGIRTVAFNDAALITCFANDYGYNELFSKSIEFYGDEGDVLVAISSSGNSINIRNGVTAAKKKGCKVITLSGFRADNPLRLMGDLNFYAPSHSYGKVEIAHLSILHAILDFIERDNG